MDVDINKLRKENKKSILEAIMRNPPPGRSRD